MIKFHCPNCQQKISAEPTEAGATGQCPTCGGDFVVPDTSADAADEEVVATAAEGAPEPTSEAIEDATHPEPVHEHEAGPSLANRFKEGAKEGWSGVKRHSKQAALRAQAEKLRNVDLRKAHHSLGKQCFESGLLEDTLAEQFQAIRDLDATIAQKREAEEVNAGETKMDAMKRMGKHAAKAGHAQALTLKREHLITELGRQVHARASEAGAEGLQNELHSIADIEARIHSKEEEASKLGDGGKGRTPTVAVAAALVLLLVAGAFVGLKVLGGDDGEKERITDSKAVSRAEDNAKYSTFSTTEEDRKYSQQAKNETTRPPAKPKPKAPEKVEPPPWTKPPYSTPNKRVDPSTAMKWLQEDCEGESVDFKEFAFNISQKTLEKKYRSATGSNLELVRGSELPPDVVVLGNNDRLFTLMADRVVHYQRTVYSGKGSRQDVAANALERMRDVIEHLHPASAGTVFTGKDEYSEYRFSEISAANFLGNVETFISTDSRGVPIASVKLSLFSREYIEKNLVPRLDWYVDAICLALKTEQASPSLRLSTGNNAGIINPPIHFEDGPRMFASGRSVISRGLIICLSKRLGVKEGTSSVKVSTCLQVPSATWECVNGFKIEVDRVKVSYEKPLSF
jgi:hypothetical protein